jgi:hypothetical protein
MGYAAMVQFAPEENMIASVTKVAHHSLLSARSSFEMSSPSNSQLTT